jgi:hypothetical protein
MEKGIRDRAGVDLRHQESGETITEDVSIQTKKNPEDKDRFFNKPATTNWADWRRGCL